MYRLQGELLGNAEYTITLLMKSTCYAFGYEFGSYREAIVRDR